MLRRMHGRPIHTVADAMEVINAAGISEETWSFPGPFLSFAIHLWTSYQVLEPEDIPGCLDDFVETQAPGAQLQSAPAMAA